MSEKKQSIWEAYKFSILLIGAILIGSLIGIHFGEAAVKLKPLGDLFINGMFMIVVPLVFITISSSIAGMNDMNRLGKIMKNLFLIFVGTGVVAFFYVFVVVKIFPPAAGVALEMPAAEALKPFQTGDQIVKAITVTDFPELISRKNMLPLIIFSIVFGICVNMIGEKGRAIAQGLEALSEVFLKMIGLLMYYAPIGLGAYFAALVGEHGKELLGSYARAIAVYYPLCLVYMFTAFPVYGYIAAGKEGIRALKHVISPAITAVATQSSIATLPVNLEACKKIGVPKDIREIVLPIGATAHMDGTVLSTILKISFLFGIFQIPFEGIGTYLSALALSVVGGVVMSGVPGGGLIGEMLIVTMYGFPAEAFPIIATIGYLVDPFATMINASGDTMASMLVTRAVEGKDWIKRNLGND
ncbi:MAG: dicarboxylate/amino acid:cation symporter [Fusobacterium mortiferum]|jgi:Na+/H+-dicarboxylate symporter|uniref:Dicarboxylate/amino acid:cation symporter n=1 Tax=Fusobacterium mortiferum ATCC 9817 TaxID=469616 RepID=A0ABM6TU20_FUSMR|nr:dicarboxylate/amino acid:cation symporter [Fusobacterium mortiferum]AVQ18260.1 dicarboxylate/amino acid:cation symporter [Fusobacterium mortiferum ATCC 9817]EEO34493.2 transporter, dicarboxylate/amino acid:cation Na+/H+ symporter family protein [Fusobacterium mortiferum ATCC 9817]MDD7261429.1 dicarboxylate/amino acid:cation symporter [Fusobacterium mortiferum]MDY5981268.1 dicarboxylate/amino acid:cation symporter [Fusobacterium mortiferum]